MIKVEYAGSSLANGLTYNILAYAGVYLNKLRIIFSVEIRFLVMFNLLIYTPFCFPFIYFNY